MKYTLINLKHIARLFCVLVSFNSFSLVAQVNDEAGQVYISIDRGENWTKASVGLPADVAVNAWVVTSSNKIIAGTDLHGIYISSDKAKSWYHSGKGLPKDVRVTALAIYKHFLFAGTYNHGIYFSDDEGETWKPTNKGLTNLTIRGFYANGSLLLVGTNDGIYRSLNDGISWSPEKKGMQVNAFASSNRQIFVATNQGVLASEDFGKTWYSIFNDAAIFRMGIGKNEIYLLDYSGKVYQSGITNFVWLKADVYLPFRYTFQPTPSSRKFFIVNWKYAFKSLDNVNQDLRFNGLPENSAFTELLETPFGLLATSGSQNGC